MIIKVRSLLGCYHLVRMKYVRKTGLQVRASMNFTFKFQSEKDEAEEMTKKEDLER